MLTAFDHWLRERFLLRTHIYTMRLPEKLPRGIKINHLPENASAQYRYRLVARTSKVTDRMVERLNESGLLFKTQVVERKTLLRKIIAPKGQSFLLNVFWLISFIGLSFGAVKLFEVVTSNEVLMDNLRESFDIFTESGS